MVHAIQMTVRFLNQMWVKEGIKEVVGAVTFGAGAVEISRMRTTVKVIAVCAQLSIILAVLTSRPSLHVYHWILGPTPNFVTNPWHPIHVASIGASVLAIPAVIQSIYGLWMGRKELIAKLASFNFFTGRPFLHIMNAACTHIRFRNL
jgi:hypothetical protein